MQSAQAQRYFDLLGTAAAPPTRDALAALVTAQLARVPFENLGKLIQHRRGEPPVLLSLDRFLDGMEFLNLGGTCYACATHFAALLQHLGYAAQLCGAAMERPDVHAVIRVELAGRPWLIDVGYAAPFCAPLDLSATTPQAVSRGGERYVLQPRRPDGRWRLNHERDGDVVHGYVVDPTPRTDDHFAPAVRDSFRPGAEFLTRLRVVRHCPTQSILVRDLEVTVVEACGTIRRRSLRDVDELGGVLEVLLQIPAATTAEAWSAIA